MFLATLDRYDKGKATRALVPRPRRRLQYCRDRGDRRGHPYIPRITVVFRPPNDPSKYYVKRVIGLPGDTVIIKDGYVFLKVAGATKEVKLDEPYLDSQNQGKTFRHPPASGDGSEQDFPVPADHYFMMGDNRQGSLDSRSFTLANGEPEPYVQRSSVKGRVWFVALPISKLHTLAQPDYHL